MELESGAGALVVLEQRGSGDQCFWFFRTVQLVALTGARVASTDMVCRVQGGFPDDSRRGQYTLLSDEPVALLGTDTAVSPAEYVLKGLAGCYTVTLAALAAARNITLEQIRLTRGFDIDLSGFLGIWAHCLRSRF